MNRNSQSDALVLHVRTFGDAHREAVILTKDRGLIRAMVYGGSRSKLKSLVSSYHSGRIWLYSDEVKKSVKVTDFDATHFRIGVRDNILKTYCAALCAELLVKTCGAGSVGIDENESLFMLVCGFLDGLDIASEAESRRGLLRFLWRYQVLLGVQCDTKCCARCDEFFAEMPCEPNARVFFSVNENAFMCLSCIYDGEAGFFISLEALLYIHAVETCSAKEVRSLPLSLQNADELKQLLFFLTTRLAEGHLNTFEAGEGIL